MADLSEAVARYYRLHRKSQERFAAYRDAHENWMAERAEVARLEADVQRFGRGLWVEVEADGGVFHYEFRRGQPRAQGMALLYPDEHTAKKPIRLDEGGDRAVKLLLAARQRLAEADQARERISARPTGVATLAEECAKLLRRRGWTPSGVPEISR